MLAIAVATIIDRLIFAVQTYQYYIVFVQNFQIIMLIITLLFTITGITRLYKHLYCLLGVIGLIILECIGIFGFIDKNPDYTAINILVTVCSLAVITNVLIANNKFSQISTISKRWLLALVIYPYRGYPDFFSLIIKFFGNFSKKSDTKTVRKVVLGLLISVPLIIIILALLMSADPLYSKMLTAIIPNFDFGQFIMHFTIIVIFSGFSYSVLAHILPFSDGPIKKIEYRFEQPLFSEPDETEVPSDEVNAKVELPNYPEKFYTAPNNQKSAPEKTEFDRVISGVILGVIIFIYLTFCAVQFVFLFGLSGLPDGYTYSQYAVQGFWQIVIITLLNLLIFGLMLTYVKGAPEPPAWFKTLLLALQILTGILIISAGLRCSMYISAYGLTWLRVLSFWFIIFLGAFLLLSIARLFVPKLPLIAIGFMVGLFWWAILGISNPHMFIQNYNNEHPVNIADSDVPRM